jgi:rod shape-determining protein MreC
MRTLIRFLITYKTLFLFLFLEVISLVLIINYNQFQRSQFLSSSNVVVGKIYEYSDAVTKYFSLRSVNSTLAQENASLRNRLYALENELSYSKEDSTLMQRNILAKDRNYTFIPAKVINATISQSKNYLTLDKGADDGIRPEMGVLNGSGVVGIISSVSSHFSVVIPVLNTSSHISAKVKNKTQTGSLVWDGKDPRKANLEEVPLYIELAEGDMVVTSGYSTIFPEGIPIGRISSFRKYNDDFYIIEVDLATDFHQLSFVDVIDYKYAEEQKELEKKEVAND